MPSGQGMSVLGSFKTSEDKSMKHAIGECMLAINEITLTMVFSAVAIVLGLRQKPAVVPREAVLGIVSLANDTLVDAKSLRIQERILATALVRAAKYNLTMMEQSEHGIVFMADAGTSAIGCRQLMMFFTELKNDFEKQGLQLRFGLTRGHELATASRLGSHGAPGEVVINRGLLNEAPAVKMKSRVIGQMRFASV